MSQKANLCYYSNRCEWSKAFMKELAQTPWANSFSFFCVDAEKRQGPLPAWLKKVPTLVISGEQQPRTDGDVMNWLSEMRLKNSGSGQRSGYGPGPAGSEPEPEGWNTMEHSSFARGFGYSFQDADTTTQGNGGSTIPGAFSFLNGTAGPSQGAPPSIADVRQKSRKEQQFDTQMEDFKKERDQGMPGNIPRM
jgi:hypothetical protein